MNFNKFCPKMYGNGLEDVLRGTIADFTKNQAKEIITESPKKKEKSEQAKYNEQYNNAKKRGPVKKVDAKNLAEKREQIAKTFTKAQEKASGKNPPITDEELEFLRQASQDENSQFRQRAQDLLKVHSKWPQQ